MWQLALCYVGFESGSYPLLLVVVLVPRILLEWKEILQRKFSKFSPKFKRHADDENVALTPARHAAVSNGGYGAGRS